MMYILVLLTVFIGLAMLVFNIPITLFNARFILLFFAAIYFSTKYNVLVKGSSNQKRKFLIMLSGSIIIIIFLFSISLEGAIIDRLSGKPSITAVSPTGQAAAGDGITYGTPGGIVSTALETKANLPIIDLERGNFTSSLNTQLVLANETKNFTETINFTSALVRSLNISYELKYLNDTKANSPVTLGYINLTGTSFIGYVNLTGSIAALERGNFTSGLNTQLILANETWNLSQVINFTSIRVAGINITDRITSDNTSQNNLINTKATSPVSVSRENITDATNFALFNQTNNFTQGQIWSAKSNITSNVTYQIPNSNGAVCTTLFRGVTANYSECFNSTGQLTINYGVFILPV